MFFVFLYKMIGLSSHQPGDSAFLKILEVTSHLHSEPGFLNCWHGVRGPSCGSPGSGLVSAFQVQAPGNSLSALQGVPHLTAGSGIIFWDSGISHECGPCCSLASSLPLGYRVWKNCCTPTISGRGARGSRSCFLTSPCLAHRDRVSAPSGYSGRVSTNLCHSES